MTHESGDMGFGVELTNGRSHSLQIKLLIPISLIQNINNIYKFDKSCIKLLIAYIIKN